MEMDKYLYKNLKIWLFKNLILNWEINKGSKQNIKINKKYNKYNNIRNKIVINLNYLKINNLIYLQSK